MEFRWDGPQQVKNLGDDPSKGQINALFAIPGDTKSDSSLPHHDVSSDGKVGAADQDGCVAAIGALNGARGGVNASQAEKNKAYSHLASHLRAMGADPPGKQFAAARDLELRAQRRSGMLHVPERLALQFGVAGVEMRARPNGTGSGPDKWAFTGYAAVYNHPFDMWDFWGDQFSEKVATAAGARTLGNNCDVPFLVGHNDAGIPMARTKSGTMSLGEDTHGLHVTAPDLDGRVEQIRQMASAVERGDLDEMSMAFMTIRQDWSPDYAERTILEYDLHKGDVSVVVFGANDGTAGASMVALPAEALRSRRPTGIRQARPEARAASLHAPMSGAHSHAHSAYGGQGEDETHTHMHVHNNDSHHGHSHDAMRSDGRPLERRDGGGTPDDDTPDYDPQVNGMAAVRCPYAVTNGCGKMNAGDARFCNGCGGALYSEDGTIIISDDGVPEELTGDSVTSMARAKAELELRQRQVALLALTRLC